MNKLLDETDFARAGADIVIKAASERVNHYLVALQQHLQGEGRVTFEEQINQ